MDYNALKRVFNAFHYGLLTKLDVAFAIGLWQLQDPPTKPPMIDKIKEFWFTYEKYYHDKARALVKRGD